MLTSRSMVHTGISLLLCSGSLYIKAAEVKAGPWTPQYRDFSCSEHISINVRSALGSEPNLIIGLESTGSPASISVALGMLQAPPRAQARRALVEDLTPHVSQVSSCGIEIGPFNDSTKRYILHGLIGPKRHVRISLNGEIQLNFTVANGATIHKGQVLVDSGELYVVEGFAQHFVRAALPGEAAEVAMGASGKRFFSPESFPKHLGAHASIENALPRSCCDDLMFISIKVVVQADGVISSVEARRGDPVWSAKIRDMLIGHQMKPFQSGGSGQAVEGIVLLAVSKSTNRIYLM